MQTGSCNARRQSFQHSPEFMNLIFGCLLCFAHRLQATCATLQFRKSTGVTRDCPHKAGTRPSKASQAGSRPSLRHCDRPRRQHLRHVGPREHRPLPLRSIVKTPVLRRNSPSLRLASLGNRSTDDRRRMTARNCLRLAAASKFRVPILCKPRWLIWWAEPTLLATSLVVVGIPQGIDASRGSMSNDGRRQAQRR